MDINVLGDAEDAIVQLCKHIQGPTLIRVDTLIGEIRRTLAPFRDDILPVAGLVLDDGRQRVVELKALLAEASGVLANAKAITSHLAEHRWVDAHIETETGKYHIRFRLEPEGE